MPVRSASPGVVRPRNTELDRTGALDRRRGFEQAREPALEGAATATPEPPAADAVPPVMRRRIVQTICVARANLFVCTFRGPVAAHIAGMAELDAVGGAGLVQWVAQTWPSGWRGAWRPGETWPRWRMTELLVEIFTLVLQIELSVRRSTRRPQACSKRRSYCFVASVPNHDLASHLHAVRPHSRSTQPQ